MRACVRACVHFSGCIRHCLWPVVGLGVNDEVVAIMMLIMLKFQ